MIGTLSCNCIYQNLWIFKNTESNLIAASFGAIDPMSNPHISSEDNSKENTHNFVLPSTSSNAFLDALSAPANNTFDNISEGSEHEEEDVEFH